MNSFKFYDRADFIGGRKIIYTTESRIDESNIVKVLNKALPIHNSNREAVEYLWGYYKGDQPILYRHKKVRKDIKNNVLENRAWEIVRFKVNQTFGEPIQYNAIGDDEYKGNAVTKLIRYLTVAHNQARNVELGEWQSATGTAFKSMIKSEGLIPFGITVFSPLDTFIVYQSGTKEPMVAYQRLLDNEGKTYYLAFTRSHQAEIRGNKVTPNSYKPHAYKGIPIIEYPNNSQRISDIEIVASLLDALNEIESNRVDGIAQFIQSFMKFINCEMDEEKYQRFMEIGAIMLKSNNGDNKADVDIMSQELNQTQTQVAKEDIIDSIYSILAIPSKQGNTGGDTQGAVELRNGWDFAKGAARLKDPFIIEAETRFIDLILNRVAITTKDLPISILDIDIKMHHSPLDNMLVKAQFLDYMLKDGVNPRVAFERSMLFPDSEKTYNESLETLDMYYRQNFQNSFQTESIVNQE